MTTYKNSYKLPSTSNPKNVHLDTAPEDYDFNYMFEVKPLRSDRVELRPFVVCMHNRLRRRGCTQFCSVDCMGWHVADGRAPPPTAYPSLSDTD